MDLLRAVYLKYFISLSQDRKRWLATENAFIYRGEKEAEKIEKLHKANGFIKSASKSEYTSPIKSPVILNNNDEHRYGYDNASYAASHTELADTNTNGATVMHTNKVAPEHVKHESTNL